MPNNQNLKNDIASVIRTNNNQEITGALLQSSLFAIINQFGSGAIFKGLASPTTNPGALDVNAFYISKGAGLYPNFNGASVGKNELAIFSNASGIWIKESFSSINSIDSIELTSTSDNVDTYTISMSDGTNTTFTVTNAEQIDAVELVNEAFKGTEAVNLTIGRPLDVFGPPSSGAFFEMPLFNNTYCPREGKIKKIRINVTNPGNIDLSHVNVNDSSKTFAIKNTFTKTLVAGINEIDVDLDCEKGDTIGIYGGPMHIRFLDQATDNGNYYSNAANPFNWNKGHICMNFDFEGTAETGFTVEEIKEILRKENNNVSSNSDHCKIFLEGQSNAFGVGALSGLIDNAPYNAVPFAWGDKFSRVFIWNPRTNNYENLQIGVNNMASWDGDYIHPSSTPTPYPTFGAEIGFAIIWENSTKKGNLYISKGIGDGRPIEYFQKGTAYYTELISRETKANKWLNDRGIFAKSIGFVWVQGEGNAGSSAASYEAALRALINDRITDGVIDGNSRKVIAQIGTTSGGYSATVAAGKNKYVATDLTSIIIDYPPYYNSDNIHLDYRGELILGINSANFILFADNLIFEQLDTREYWTF